MSQGNVCGFLAKYLFFNLSLKWLKADNTLLFCWPNTWRVNNPLAMSSLTLRTKNIGGPIRLCALKCQLSQVCRSCCGAYQGTPSYRHSTSVVYSTFKALFEKIVTVVHGKKLTNTKDCPLQCFILFLWLWKGHKSSINENQLLTSSWITIHFMDTVFATQSFTQELVTRTSWQYFV